MKQSHWEYPMNDGVTMTMMMTMMMMPKLPNDWYVDCPLPHWNQTQIYYVNTMIVQTWDDCYYYDQITVDWCCW